MNNNMPATGSIQKKDGKFYAVLNIVEKGQRRQKWISTGYSIRGGKKKANEFLQNVLTEYNAQMAIARTANINGIPVKCDSEDLLFSGYMKKWLKTKKPNIDSITYQGYERMVSGKIRKFFDDHECTMSFIQVSDIEAFYASLYEQGLTGNTALRYHAVIRQALTQAYRKGVIQINIMSYIDAPRKGKFIPAFYSEKEALEMLDAIQGDTYYLPIMLATYYGLTRSEVLGLRWKSIDFAKSILRVEHKVIPEKVDGKTVIVASDKLKTDARRRTLPLIEVVANELKMEQERQQRNKKILKNAYNTKYQDYVCVDATGKLLMPNTLSKHFNLVLTKNGLRTIRFHDLRHTCASLLVANGVSMKQVQIWLGHSNYSTTADVYSHLESTAQLESANCLERVLSKPEPQAT